jgi:hypothetical protein
MGERGPEGPQGPAGEDGGDGVDGRGITDVYTAADGDFVFVLTDGTEISVEAPLLSGTGAGEVHHYIQRGSGGNENAYTWVEYAANFLTPPVFVETISEGDVYEYTYSSGVLYRLVGETEDSFYSTFNTPNLSGLVISRDLNI